MFATHDISILYKCSSFSNTSKNSRPLLRLIPFLCKNCVIRVGGRKIQIHQKFIKNTQYYGRPTVHSHAYSFSNKHKISTHGRPQLILACIRLKYWAFKRSKQCQKVIRRCVKCFEYKSIVVQPFISDLSRDQVEFTRTLAKCVVDIAGLVHVKSSLCHKMPTYKAYICV